MEYLNNKSINAHVTLHDSDRKPITSTTDLQLSFLKDLANAFSNMSPQKVEKDSCLPKQTIRVMTLTKATSHSLVQTLNGLANLCDDLLNDSAVKYVLLGRFQSDALEGEFGIYRGMFGGLYHITFEQLLIAGKFRRLELLLDFEIHEEASDDVPHNPHCCVSEFTNDECQFLDSVSVDTLSDTEKQVIFYIAGYIAKKEDIEYDTK